MDVRSLRYFIAAYEGGSISAAARRCHVAQPSISTALVQLEERLGTPLFERHRRGITPTEEGHRLYPLARQVSEDLDAISRLFRTPAPPTPVRLGLMRSLGANRMTALLKEYIGQGDNLALTLVNPEERCDARIIGEQDLSPGEAFQPIWHDSYLLALPSGHPLGLKGTVSLVDLDGLPFIWRHPCAAMQELATALSDAGVRCQVRARLRTIEYTLGLVAAGVGASLVPAWPEILAHPDVQSRPLAELDIRQTIGVAYPARQAMPALAPLLQLGRAAWEARERS
ncbi:LysR family transcriptional regulator [Billgrantia tianxiuensis]|jgi:DNA-binding transcriptional LysR family regulator|uniref:LysR family transcriptional regulator n=1 Tax=Billgrantia tianxiuensis TaxID=2497861 RepID=A0A6I6SJM7_9GAMM|nr:MULTISPECIES: LysR family transcriptional regulator [Halomonas]MCE8035623.1 LysR family transcriptional regulator [Halomonas sp. MCCC 1A11057]QHC50769.1 LysR family transcriptional regulator [Halomonas tianxiuensis]